MTECIKDNLGAIGCIDAGHGFSAGLAKVSLQNRHGQFLTSQQALAAHNGSLDVFQSRGSLPLTADADFGNVTLIDRPGKHTWPMVQCTCLCL